MATTTQPQPEALDKGDDYVEEKYLDAETHPSRFLSEAHKSYLIDRHGTVDLDPIPSTDPADPYNWPSWKVRI